MATLRLSPGETPPARVFIIGRPVEGFNHLFQEDPTNYATQQDAENKIAEMRTAHPRVFNNLRVEEQILDHIEAIYRPAQWYDNRKDH